MVIYDFDHPLNKPSAWANDIKRTELGFGPRRFQRQINRIVGATALNQPIIRLEWAPDMVRWEAGYFRHPYRCYTEWVDGEPVDVPVPRWVLTQRTEPARYLAAWHRNRYVDDPETGEQVDAMGEPPPDGWYQHLVTLTTHHDGCCKRFGRMKCWGLYWEPDDRVLDLLRQMKAERDAQPHKYDVTAPMGDQELRDATRGARSWNEGLAERRKTETRERMADLWKTHGRKLLTGDPDDKAREYSLPTPPGYQQTESGLYMPAV